MTDDELERRAAGIYNLLSKACDRRKVKLDRGDISVPLVAELAFHLHKDLGRINEHQLGDAAVQNYMGFFVFWVSKLKPIRVIEHRGKLITDINEQAAIWACHLLFEKLPYIPKVQKDVLALKGDKESKKRVLDHAFRFFMADGRYISLVYTVRHRNITGDALTMYFGAIIRAALLKRQDAGG